MVKIKRATSADIEVLALLGTVTYTESHGHFIENKDDLLAYNKKAFSVSRTRTDINDPKNRFYILYFDDLPVGYAKLILHTMHEGIVSKNNCRIERIYILNDFIPLKLGQQFMTFLEEEAKALYLDLIWLTVYIKNDRAIRFYKRNNFDNVGTWRFMVNGKAYDNTVLSKRI